MTDLGASRIQPAWSARGWTITAENLVTGERYHYRPQSSITRREAFRRAATRITGTARAEWEPDIDNDRDRYTLVIPARSGSRYPREAVRFGEYRLTVS